MGVPLVQQYRIARYILGKKLSGQQRYPLVLMLEPLFRCNLACAGCGKIDYPEEVLDKRLSVAECMQAVDECGAPMVSIAGGEPLIHSDMPEIVRGFVARRRFVYLCTNALLLERRMDDYSPSSYLTFSIHLDGSRERHDASVCRAGVFDKCIRVIRQAPREGVSGYHQLHPVPGGVCRGGGRVHGHGHGVGRGGSDYQPRIQL